MQSFPVREILPSITRANPGVCGENACCTAFLIDLSRPTVQPARTAEASVRSDAGGFDVLPANRELAGAEIELVSLVARETRLDRALRAYLVAESLAGRPVDYVFIDCPPSLGALTREALAAADRAVIVTTPTYFGAQGVQRAVEEITEIASGTNPDLTLAGVVINKVRSVSEEHDFRVKEMIALVGAKSVLKPPMPERIAFQQAEGTGTPVQLLGTTGSREVTVILDTYLTSILQ